jgi:hypothetical protein
MVMGCPADDTTEQEKDNTPKVVAEKYRGTYRTNSNNYQIILTENQFTNSSITISNEVVSVAASDPTVTVWTVGDELWNINSGKEEKYTDVTLNYQNDVNKIGYQQLTYIRVTNP